jgi:hypothetical protein
MLCFSDFETRARREGMCCPICLAFAEYMRGGQLQLGADQRRGQRMSFRFGAQVRCALQ